MTRRAGVVRAVVLTVCLALVVSFAIACEWLARIPDYVLEARSPNVTAPTFIKPSSKEAAPSHPDATLLLFVHGLFGDTVSTWSRAGGRALPVIMAERKDFGGKLDTFAFGFPSSMIKLGSFSVPEAAKNLVSNIRYFELLSKYERIVIVAHSMGGLVALEALTTYADLKSKVPLVITFGTPYNGSQATRIAKDVLENPALRDMVERDGQGGNSLLTSLTNRWKERKDDSGTRTQVKCAYETLTLPKFGVLVPEGSGTALCDGAADAIGADHIMMVKPDNDEHDAVKVITNALRALPPVEVQRWTPLTPLPADLPPALHASEIGPVLLGIEHPLGPSARSDLSSRRRQAKYTSPGAEWFVFSSPRYHVSLAPRRLEMIPGLDGLISVVAVDDSGQPARILSRPRTIGSDFRWNASPGVEWVRFLVFVFPLSESAERQISQSKDISRLMTEVR